MTPEQRKAAMETMQQWRADAVHSPQPGLLATFWDDVKAYQEGRLQDIEPGLREDQKYMTQLAAIAHSLKLRRGKAVLIESQPLDPNQHITALVYDDGRLELRPRQEDKDAIILDADQLAVLRELLWRHEPEQQAQLPETFEDEGDNVLYTVTGRAEFAVTLKCPTPEGAIDQAQEYLRRGFPDPDPSACDATLSMPGKIVVTDVEMGAE